MRTLARPISRRSQQHSAIKALLVAVLLVVAQVAGIFHLSRHDADRNSDHCEMCQAAAHFGNAAVPEVFQFTLPAHVVMLVAEAALPHFYTAFPSIYASRAPPALA